MDNSQKGPFVQAALICRHLLREVDDVLSAIRIVDRLRFQVPSDVEAPVLELSDLSLLVILKSGEVEGDEVVELHIDGPGPGETPAIQMPVYFGGGDEGVALGVALELEITIPGVYWFDLMFRGRRLTRVPLRIEFEYQPASDA